MTGGRSIPYRLAAGVIAALALWPAAAASAEEVKLTDWTVAIAFRTGEPPTVCSVRFPAPRGTPTLTLEARPPKKSSELEALFTLGGLPPLLAGKKGIIRDIRMSIGTSWSGTTLKGDWSRGTAEANSKVAIHADPAIATVVQPIANGGVLTIALPLANGERTFSFELSGSLAPMKAFVDCLRRWTPGS
jgi:hypothetical protein